MKLQPAGTGMLAGNKEQNMCHGSPCPYEVNGDKCKLPLGKQCWQDWQTEKEEQESEEDEN